ncbi:MAG: aldo/keto reductase [Candidatus Nanohaloarchaea archaeon]
MEYVEVDGVNIPSLGLGTARMEGEECKKAVIEGLEAGYRHVDTAQMYGNEAAVGSAIEESEVDRDEVFLVTKLDRPNMTWERVLESVDDSLDRLKTDYIDLLLIHAPSDAVPLEETVNAMNRLQESGKVNHIGVSNFSIEQLERARELSDSPIVTNQVKYNPFNSQEDMLEYCADNGVMLTAYSPLAVGKAVSNDTLKDIGKKYGKTPAQVALRWLTQQRNVAAIPKASTEKHAEENIEIFDFELDEEDMERIFELQGGLLDRLKSKIGL